MKNQNNILHHLKRHPWIIAGSTSLLIAFGIASFYLHNQLVVLPTARIVQYTAEAHASGQAGAVNQFVRTHKSQIAALAAERDLLEQVIAGNEDKIGDWEKVIARTTGAKAARIRSVRDADTGNSGNFVARELERRARNGEEPAPEAVKLDNSWTVLGVTPIRDGDTVVGTLLVELPSERLESALKSLDPGLGRTQLVQHFSQFEPQPVVTTGRASTDVATRKPTEVPHWRIEFTAGEQLIASASQPTRDFWVLFLSLAVVVLLVIVLLVRIALRSKAAEQTVDTGESPAEPAPQRQAPQGNTPQRAPVSEKKTPAPETPVAKDEGESKAGDREATTEGEEKVAENPDSREPEKSAVPTKPPANPLPPSPAPAASGSTTREQPAAEQPVSQTAAANPSPQPAAGDPQSEDPAEEPCPASVFRDYDIRGIAGSEIDTKFAEALGRVLGTHALAMGETTMVTGMDGRTSSPDLSRALSRGILATGCNIINLGRIPTPLMNFAVHTLSQTRSGVMVTASHNPARDNGFKMVFGGVMPSSEEIAAFRQQMLKGDWAQGKGSASQMDIAKDYVDKITEDVVPANDLKVVVDCGNGIAGEILPDVLQSLGCRVTTLYCDVDGNFPHHEPDPTVAANLKDLITVVKHEGADLGLAVDGDGDRLVAISASGRIIWPDELLMIFARDVITRHPGGDVVFDVKSTRRLSNLVSSYGGRPVMWKTGHSHMRNKVRETGAPLGGEFSGHLFFNDRWYGFDDGIYATARLLEIMTLREQTLDDIMAGFPETFYTGEIKVPVSDTQKFGLIQRLLNSGGLGEGKVTTLDGFRVDFPDCWGLVRASNTTPALTLRFEGDTREALAKVQALFKERLLAVGSELSLPF